MKKLRNIYIEKCLKGIVTYGNCVRKISKSVVITHSKNFPLYFNDSNTGKRFKKYDVGRIIINSNSIFEFTDLFTKFQALYEQKLEQIINYLWLYKYSGRGWIL